MGTTADKLNAVLASKNAIRDKFGLAATLPFSQYADNINAGSVPTVSTDIYRCMAVNKATVVEEIKYDAYGALWVYGLADARTAKFGYYGHQASYKGEYNGLYFLQNDIYSGTKRVWLHPESGRTIKNVDGFWGFYDSKGTLLIKQPTASEVPFDFREELWGGVDVGLVVAPYIQYSTFNVTGFTKEQVAPGTQGGSPYKLQLEYKCTDGTPAHVSIWQRVSSGQSYYYTDYYLTWRTDRWYLSGNSQYLVYTNSPMPYNADGSSVEWRDASGALSGAVVGEDLVPGIWDWSIYTIKDCTANPQVNGIYYPVYRDEVDILNISGDASIYKTVWQNQNGYTIGPLMQKFGDGGSTPSLAMGFISNSFEGDWSLGAPVSLGGTVLGPFFSISHDSCQQNAASYIDETGASITIPVFSFSIEDWNKAYNTELSVAGGSVTIADFHSVSRTAGGTIIYGGYRPLVKPKTIKFWGPESNMLGTWTLVPSDDYWDWQYTNGIYTLKYGFYEIMTVSWYAWQIIDSNGNTIYTWKNSNSVTPCYMPSDIWSSKPANYGKWWATIDSAYRTSNDVFAVVEKCDNPDLIGTYYKKNDTLYIKQRGEGDIYLLLLDDRWVFSSTESGSSILYQQAEIDVDFPSSFAPYVEAGEEAKDNATAVYVRYSEKGEAAAYVQNSDTWDGAIAELANGEYSFAETITPNIPLAANGFYPAVGNIYSEDLKIQYEQLYGPDSGKYFICSYVNRNYFSYNIIVVSGMPTDAFVGATYANPDTYEELELPSDVAARDPNGTYTLTNPDAQYASQYIWQSENGCIIGQDSMDGGIALNPGTEYMGTRKLWMPSTWEKTYPVPEEYNTSYDWINGDYVVMSGVSVVVPEPAPVEQYWEGYKLIQNEDGKYDYASEVTRLTYADYMPVIGRIYDGACTMEITNANLSDDALWSCPRGMTANENDEWLVSIIDNTVYNNQESWYAFDGSNFDEYVATYFRSNNASSRWYLQWQNKLRPVLLKEIYGMPGAGDYGEHWNGSDWQILGSNDGTNWDLLFSGSWTRVGSWGTSGGYDCPKFKITITGNYGAYYYYRIGRSSSNNFWQSHHFEAYAQIPREVPK